MGAEEAFERIVAHEPSLSDASMSEFAGLLRMRGMPDDRLDPSTLEERLRGGRYSPTDATLERVSRSPRRERPPLAGAAFWRSRLALVLALVFGIGLSTSGGALAVSG